VWLVVLFEKLIHFIRFMCVEWFLALLVFLYVCLFLAVLGLELRASHLIGGTLPLEHLTSCLAMSFWCLQELQWYTVSFRIFAFLSSVSRVARGLSTYFYLFEETDICAIGILNSFSFLKYIIVALEVHCDIYKSSYNIS
jgi:hypothetical protein